MKIPKSKFKRMEWIIKIFATLDGADRNYILDRLQSDHKQAIALIETAEERFQEEIENEST